MCTTGDDRLAAERPPGSNHAARVSGLLSRRRHGRGGLEDHAVGLAGYVREARRP